MAGTAGPDENTPPAPVEALPIHPTAGELSRDDPRGAEAAIPALLNPADGPPGAVVCVQAGCGPAGGGPTEELEAGGGALFLQS